MKEGTAKTVNKIGEWTVRRFTGRDEYNMYDRVKEKEQCTNKEREDGQRKQIGRCATISGHGS